MSEQLAANKHPHDALYSIGAKVSTRAWNVLYTMMVLTKDKTMRSS
jgi:hypothetical protein